MDTSFIQSFLEKAQIKLDEKFWKQPSKESDILANMVKITEEVWELAEQVMIRQWRQDDRKGEFDKTELEYEIADVILSTTMLANAMNIDLEQALEKKMKKISKKFNM